MKITCIAGLLAMASVAFAESPFVGTWKLNRDKTQRDPRAGILKIESDGKGGIRYISSHPIYGGPLDGSKRPGLGSWAADTFLLRKVGERSYSSTRSRKGVDVSREVVEVSADGKTLTDSFTETVPRKDGKQPKTVSFFNRAGGEGKPYPFIGVWKLDSKRTQWDEEPAPMIITESGGVLTISNPVNDSKSRIDLDKSEVTATGAAYATDTTRSVKKIGERSFEMTTVRAGLTTKWVYEVSADRRILSLRGSSTDAEGQPRVITSIYERQ